MRKITDKQRQEATELADWIVNTRCMSQFEGCACWEEKGHEGLHFCGAVSRTGKRVCDASWTTEQATGWLDDILDR